jgi:uncharacterized membrane protein
LEHGRESRRPRPRIETLSDLIFGLSLSLGSFALIIDIPSSTSEVAIHMLEFSFSFFILLTAWIIYTSIASVLPFETFGMVVMNMVLLLLVAFEPYLLNILEFNDPSISVSTLDGIRNFAGSLFSVDLAGLLFLFALMYHIIANPKKKLVSEEFAKIAHARRLLMFALGAVVFVSVLPVFDLVFLGVTLRVFFWVIPFLTYWGFRAYYKEIT